MQSIRAALGSSRVGEGGPPLSLFETSALETHFKRADLSARFSLWRSRSGVLGNRTLEELREFGRQMELALWSLANPRLSSKRTRLQADTFCTTIDAPMCFSLISSEE